MPHKYNSKKAKAANTTRWSLKKRQRERARKMNEAKWGKKAEAKQTQKPSSTAKPLYKQHKPGCSGLHKQIIFHPCEYELFSWKNCYRPEDQAMAHKLVHDYYARELEESKGYYGKYGRCDYLIIECDENCNSHYSKNWKYGRVHKKKMEKWWSKSKDEHFYVFMCDCDIDKYFNLN